ncbi:conjugative transfer signal peptidase TraF [Paremcibacter congregatus]|uniref:Signal peptidase I n=1 Tax=Paremcibacter congregatus TaxID=2043170 RepID=A0A2G4YWP5_9PROT|nr:conjugative transfer signal peptidase TraF [Paremcibacter congregatus]PHZ86764.1 S26 family signal peptidase [Paremcibacter congregatus]QDE26274.1 conjugative transfer signal peptidase TraF [Paremcibacter congregatus]QDE28019.1 conjugative transfer signal peptidase TraF [Paremcibacter congregatus]
MTPRYLIIILAAVSCLLIGVSMTEFAPRILYNPSPSAPMGFYVIRHKREFKIGDYVLIELPQSVRELALERRYVGPDIPLLKRIFALSGDHICIRHEVIYVNDQAVADVKNHDLSGRIMPVWNGCRRLKTGEVFLLSLHSDYSFDSRYFGPISRKKIIGVAVYF